MRNKLIGKSPMDSSLLQSVVQIAQVTRRVKEFFNAKGENLELLAQNKKKLKIILQQKLTALNPLLWPKTGATLSG